MAQLYHDYIGRSIDARQKTKKEDKNNLTRQAHHGCAGAKWKELSRGALRLLPAFFCPLVLGYITNKCDIGKKLTVDDLHFVIHYLRSGQRVRDDLTESREDGGRACCTKRQEG
jgi:hypothetical protein